MPYAHAALHASCSAVLHAVLHAACYSDLLRYFSSAFFDSHMFLAGVTFMYSFGMHVTLRTHSTLAVVCSFGMTHNCLFFKTFNFNLNDQQKKLDDL
jgi:hypothetical protein